MTKTLGQGNPHYRGPLTLVVGFYNSGPNPCKLRHGGVTIVTVVLSHMTQLCTIVQGSGQKAIASKIQLQGSAGAR